MKTRSAFTMVEAIVALSITSIAGAALLVGLNSNLQLGEHLEQQVIARGLARQLMDEILGNRYMALGVDPYQTAFSPSSWESVPGTRERYDDIDDYHASANMPPVDEYGIQLGTEDGQGGQRNSRFQIPSGFLDRWERQVKISYVNPADLSQSLASGQTSDYRAVEVKVIYHHPESGPHELAKIRRVVSYVPTIE